VCHSSLRAAVPPRPSPRGCEEFSVSTGLDTLFQSKVALMRMELLQLVDVRVEEASRPLREEVATLKLLLAHAGVSLEPAQTRTADGLGLAPVQAACPFDSAEQKSSVVEEDHLHGCFSPRGSLCLPSQPDMLVASESEGTDGALAPVPITPVLNELCGGIFCDASVRVRII
jgi:hypothetical protein